MADKLSRPIISVPVTLQRRESKRLMKQRAKELEAKHSKYYRGDRKSPALIQCRRHELNHYRGQVYSPFNRLPMATEHWMSRSTIGEYVLVAVTFKQIFNLFYMYSLECQTILVHAVKKFLNRILKCTHTLPPKDRILLYIHYEMC